MAKVVVMDGSVLEIYTAGCFILLVAWGDAQSIVVILFSFCDIQCVRGKQ